jgi:acetylornithine deacetylase/succinyl-diaminopimelate desuccinylase-like protein
MRSRRARYRRGESYPPVARQIQAGEKVYQDFALFHDAEGAHAHGLNERIRVVSLMNGRRFLYEIVKIYADRP